LPKGGFGNLIALPLHKKARNLGNSIFVDENLMAYEDQWVFLSNLHKISRLEIENILAKADAKGRVIGARLDIAGDDQNTQWTLRSSRRSPSPPIGNVPKSLELVIGNQIYIAKESLSPGLRNRLIRLAAFQNPEFYKVQAMRFPTYEIPRIIACAEDHPNHIALTRGFFEDVCCQLSDLNIKMILREELCVGQPLNASFQGQLRHR